MYGCNSTLVSVFVSNHKLPSFPDDADTETQEPVTEPAADKPVAERSEENKCENETWKGPASECREINEDTSHTTEVWWTETLVLVSSPYYKLL